MALFQTYPPGPHLAHVVEYYWRSVVSLNESLTQDVSTPLMQGMTFNLNRLTEKMAFGDRVQEMSDYCYLFGQPAGHRLSHSHYTGVDIFGIKFTPTGIYTLAEIDMQQVADSIISADCIWGREVEWLCEAMYETPDVRGMIRIVEQFLLSKIRQQRQLNIQPLEYAVRYMQSERIYSVKDVLDKVYLSERTMQRHFISWIGMTPKQYAQICRFNAVKKELEQIPQTAWSKTICAYGYYDQSHFIREFKKFSPNTPINYSSVEEMQRGGGIITEEDLKAYTAVERTPVVFDYKGYEIITMGLPSSGGVVVQQMMEMIKPYPLKEYDFHSREAVNLMVEVERRAYADRTEYMGDPDFVDVPVSKLLDPAYVRSRMDDFVPLKPSKSENIKAGLGKEKEETTHFSIIDKDGNMVSLTTTINGNYGSRVVVGGAGFLLNNEMDDFSAKPGVPNKFGLLGTEANSIAAGKRMLSAMTPTLVKKDNKPYAVIGTPGGSTIITSVFQTLLNIIEFDMSAYDAVNKPKFHHQWQPDLIHIEKAFDPQLREELEAIGYVLKERANIGRTEVLLIRDGVIEAVGDNRGDDSVAGY